MKKILAIVFLSLFVFLSVYLSSQTNFNLDCYQKYKKCIKENEKAEIPCSFEICSFEQCICKETTVPNPVTHMDDTDPGAWGTAITVCSPWSNLISQCVEKNYGRTKNSNINDKIKEKIAVLISKLEKVRERIKTRKTRETKSTNAIKKIDSQIKSLKKILNKSKES